MAWVYSLQSDSNVFGDAQKKYGKKISQIFRIFGIMIFGTQEKRSKKCRKKCILIFGSI